MAHLARFRLAGDPSDLQEYVGKAEESRRLALPSYRGEALVNLGVAYAERYEHTGDPRDLDASIEAGEEALAHPGVIGQHRSSCLGNLSVAYRLRFGRFGAQADLDHAIQLGGRALRALPDGHPAFASRVVSLTNAYAARFDRDKDRADLDGAVELCERALAVVGINQADRRLLQSNLGGHLLRRFQVYGDRADVDASVGYNDQALDAITDTDSRWPLFADGLAGALLHRHQLLAADGSGGADSDADLERAVDLIDRALAATRPDSGSFLSRVRKVAVAYQEARIDPERRLATVRRLIDAAERATDTTPTVLAGTQTNIASLARQAGLLTEAAAMYRKAVELLPRCAAPGLAWSDQEHQISGSRGLVGEAIATHIAIGDAVAAVELAELGRGVLLSNQLNGRADQADTAALSRAAPGLADEFEALAAEMDDRSRIGEPLHDLGGALARRQPATDLGDRWDRLIHRIRELPGFSDFLAPPRVAELQRAATGGAVVLVNVGSLGGDAVVLTPDAVTPIHLPKLTMADAEAHANALAGVEFMAEEAVPIARVTSPRGATHDVLAWLWEVVTEPVLTVLGHRSPPRAGQLVPRVWWVPTGVLSLLPLHAAGLPHGPSALDLVVSSYAPSVRALMLARRRASAQTRTQLAITMRHTDGLPPLPAAAVETAHLLARHPNAIVLEDDDATATAVLDALPGATWVHLACHAISHPEKASKSGLYLHDGVLRVPEISGVDLRGGELAYLSACSTGQSSIFQADEAIHLASAFQLAGYRHVVATLWQVNDQVAAMATRRFYRLLGAAPTADGAASALHDVTLRLRERFPGEPALWASFVHSGP